MNPYVRLLRPHQWLKNLILLFPPFLGGVLNREGLWAQVPLPLLAFCLVSSAGYIFNDLHDADVDVHHPRKRNRPIASGLVPAGRAVWLGGALWLGGMVSGGFVSLEFLVCLGLYFAISIAYSLRLKHLPVVDLFCIASGFLLRLQAGGAAFGVPLSQWLFLSVFLLSVFLASGKRLAEKLVLGEEAGEHRAALSSYPDGYLEGVLFLTGAAALVAYSMYVVGRPALLYTVPLCAFGLLRYIFRVKSGEGGDPTEALLRDRLLLAVGVVWALSWGLVTYRANLGW